MFTLWSVNHTIPEKPTLIKSYMQSSSDIDVLQKLATSYKVTLMNFLVDIHINNPPTLYKVNLIAGGTNTAELRWIYDWAGEGNISRQLSPQRPISSFPLVKHPSCGWTS